MPLPHSPHCSVWWGWGGQGVRVAFRQFELFFPGSEPQQRHRACLLPPRQLCPRAQLPSPAACPPARAKRPLGPPLWQAWAHPPSQESLGGGEQLATGEKMLTPTSQCCGHQTTDPAHHRHADPRTRLPGLRGLFTQQDRDWEIKGGFPGGRRPVPSLDTHPGHTQGQPRRRPGKEPKASKLQVRSTR